MEIIQAQEDERRWGRSAIDLSEKTLPSLKAQRVLEALDGLRGEARVLDYGCGEGKLLSTIHSSRPDLDFFGVDIQPPLAPQPWFEFALVKDESCAFFQEKFDVILSLDVLEHVPDLEKALERISNMLTKEGKFVLFVPAEGEALSPFGFYRWILGADVYIKTKSHVHAYRKKQVLELMAKYFEIDNVSYSYHVFGTILDSTFFALTSLKNLARWFWKKNSIYHPENKKKGFMNRLMEWANVICYYESTWFRSSPLFASGLHVVATKKVSKPVF